MNSKYLGSARDSFGAGLAALACGEPTPVKKCSVVVPLCAGLPSGLLDAATNYECYKGLYSNRNLHY